MGMDENKGLWVDMSYPSVTTPGTYTHTMMLGFQYFLDHVEKVYVEKRGCEPEEAKKTYVNDVAAWFLDNGVREIEVPILAGHSADFIDGMDSAKNFFMKEIEKAKTRVVDTMKMEW